MAEPYYTFPNDAAALEFLAREGYVQWGPGIVPENWRETPNYPTRGIEPEHVAYYLRGGGVRMNSSATNMMIIDLQADLTSRLDRSGAQRIVDTPKTSKPQPKGSKDSKSNTASVAPPKKKGFFGLGRRG